jgi:FAD/FMN-containing dehydrogenase
VVLDTTRLDAITDRPGRADRRVQPGVVLDALRDAAPRTG